MAEVTDAGIYREWWANPAVVGLMGFGSLARTENPWIALGEARSCPAALRSGLASLQACGVVLSVRGAYVDGCAGRRSLPTVTMDRGGIGASCV
jgi:hypothetical protein